MVVCKVVLVVWVLGNRVSIVVVMVNLWCFMVW